MTGAVAFLHVDKPLPTRANLCGIGFSIVEHEGLIVFSEACPVWGMGCRFSFHRDSAGSWAVSIDANCAEEKPSMSPDRIDQAFRIVQECRGDSFRRPFPRPEGWSDMEWSRLVAESRDALGGLDA